MRCANAFCYSIVGFVFSAAKTLEIKNLGATIQEKRTHVRHRNEYILIEREIEQENLGENVVFICIRAACQAERQ